ASRPEASSDRRRRRAGRDRRVDGVAPDGVSSAATTMKAATAARGIGRDAWSAAAREAIQISRGRGPAAAASRRGGRSAWQSEQLVRDHLALDLRRPAHDRVGAREEEEAEPPAGPLGALVVEPEEPARSEHLHRERPHALRELAPEELLERRLGTDRLAARLRRQAATAEKAHDLEIDVRLGELLAYARVAVRAAPAREFEELRQVLRHVAVEHERPHRTALVREDAHRDLPAVARLSDDVVARDADLIEEDLVELRLARHLAERADVDAGLLHVDEGRRDAGVLLCVGIGAGEEEAPVRDLGDARPDLLAAHDPVVAVEDGARPEA